MATATRATTSGLVGAASPLPTEAPQALAKPAERESTSTWEYYLFCIMVLCMVVMWGMMLLDLFGSGFWVIFDLPK